MPGIDDPVAVDEGVVFRTVDGEAVLLHAERGLYFSLDPIGTRVWEALVEHGRARPVIVRLLEEFDVTREALERDVERLLGDLAQSGLIHGPS